MRHVAWSPSGTELIAEVEHSGKVEILIVPLDDPGESFDLTVEYAGEINGPRGGANNQRLWDYIGPEGTYVRFESGWYPQVWGDRATAVSTRLSTRPRTATATAAQQPRFHLVAVVRRIASSTKATVTPAGDLRRHPHDLFRHRVICFPQPVRRRPARA